MNEIEWLDKVQKNFEYKEEESMTMNQYFREMYQGYDWGSIITPRIFASITPSVAGVYYPVPIITEG